MPAILLLTTFLLLTFTIAPTLGHAADRQPNFLFILGDNVGQDWFGCYGSDEKCSPNVDKLAATGVRFEHCYVTPLCSTTRAALLTGRYGFRTGWHTHHDAAIYGGGGFDWRREMTWARLLQAAGYKTAIAGKWQINDLSVDTDALSGSGFDEHLVWTGALLGTGTSHDRWQSFLKAGKKHELESRYWNPVIYRNGKQTTLHGRFGPDVYAEYLIDFMQRHRDQPFVAYYATPLVHIPTVTSPHSPNSDTPEREQFAGMVRYLDHQVGRLVAELESLGLRENTIVIFTTDNGSPTRLGGMVGGQRALGGLGSLTEGGLDVPLVVNCPARFTRPRVSQALTDCTDFFPTLLEWASVELPRDRQIDGRSFAAQLTSDASAPLARDWIFAQSAETRVVRDRRFKLYSTGALYDLRLIPWKRSISPKTPTPPSSPPAHVCRTSSTNFHPTLTSPSLPAAAQHFNWKLHARSRRPNKARIEPIELG